MSPAHEPGPLERLRAALDDAPPLSSQLDPDAFGRWRGLAELADRWIELAARGARALDAGTSASGLPLPALEVGPADAAEVALVVAGLHAMEWIGVEAAHALLERLVAEPPCGRRVLFVLVVNVDGYRRVEANLRARRWRFVRANARGVDLNRNWPTAWQRRHLPSLVLPWLGGPGSAPASEPEIAGILAALDRALAHGGRLRAALSLHSFGRMILHAYGGRWRPPDDLAPTLDAARAMRARIGYPYRIVQCARWVPGAFAHGLEIDHLHERYGAVALLVECSRGGASPSRPATWLHPFRWFNPPRAERELAALVPALEAFVRST